MVGQRAVGTLLSFAARASRFAAHANSSDRLLRGAHKRLAERTEYQCVHEEWEVTCVIVTQSRVQIAGQKIVW